MFSGFSCEPSPLITVWLEVRSCRATNEIDRLPAFADHWHRKCLENLGNAFSVHRKISIEKPAREVEDPSSAAVDHRKSLSVVLEAYGRPPSSSGR